MFLKYLNFCPNFFGHVRKPLDKKPKVISKFMMSWTGKQMITILILPNISTSKGNETMRFGKLIEYNIIFKNHAQNEADKVHLPNHQ